MSLETMTEIYNKYSLDKITAIDLLMALEKSGFIAKNNMGKPCNKTVDSVKIACEMIPVKRVEDIVCIEL